MTAQSKATVREHSNSYDIFILVLTLMSLAIMVLMVLPLAPAELDTLRVYDNLICFVFIGDFLYNLTGSHPRSEYFVHRRGWTDILGSIRAWASSRPSGCCVSSVSSGSSASRGCCGASGRRS